MSGPVAGSSGIASGGDPNVPALANVTVERVAPWKWNAEAAYTITHDDLCDTTTSGQFDYALVALRERGLRVAFGAIVEVCDRRGMWNELQRLIDDGHEILNHGWSHKSLVTGTRDFPFEIDQAKVMLDTRLGAPTLFFIFPYDEFDESAVAAVRAAGHWGARAGNRGLNGPTFDDFAVSWDTYGPSYSIYRDDPEKSQDILNAFVEDALVSGSWAVRELHGVQDQSWEPVPLDEYVAHLDRVKALVESRRLWMDGPTAIIKYRRAAAECGAPVAAGMTLSFPIPSEACARYAVPLSVVMHVDTDAPSIEAVQGGAIIESVTLGPRAFLVNAHPLNGDVQLRVADLGN